MYMYLILGLWAWLIGLFGGGKKSAEAAPESKQPSVAERMVQAQKEAATLAKEQAAQKAARNKELETPGPMLVKNVTQGSGPALAVTFELGDKELLVTHASGDPTWGEQVYRLPWDFIYSVAAGGSLRIDLHVPIPLWVDGSPLAIRALFAEIDDALADERWSRLGERHFPTAPTCPNCFKSGIEAEPPGTGVPQPMENGKPVIKAICQGCHTHFLLDLKSGLFNQVEG